MTGCTASLGWLDYWLPCMQAPSHSCPRHFGPLNTAGPFFRLIIQYLAYISSHLFYIPSLEQQQITTFHLHSQNGVNFYEGPQLRMWQLFLIREALLHLHIFIHDLDGATRYYRQYCESAATGGCCHQVFEYLERRIERYQGASTGTLHRERPSVNYQRSR